MGRHSGTSSAAAVSPRVLSRQPSKTVMPRRPSCRATSWPSPLLAPVTRATQLDVMSCLFNSVSVCDDGLRSFRTRRTAFFMASRLPLPSQIYRCELMSTIVDLYQENVYHCRV